MMAQFGRDAWRSQAEVFTVWFRLLGRLAPYRARRRGRAGPPPSVRQRPAGAGLDAARRRRSSPSASARSSSTACRRRSSGSTSSASRALLNQTACCSASSGSSSLAALAGHAGGRRGRHERRPAADRRRLPHRPLPDLPAHRRAAHRHRHLRPVPAGWDLFGTAFYEPTGAWLPPGLVWTLQLAAVVGGHMLGAWGGHVVGALEAPTGLSAGRSGSARCRWPSSWSRSRR